MKLIQSKKAKNKKKLYFGSHINWNFSNEATLCTATSDNKMENLSFAPLSYGNGHAGRAPSRTCVRVSSILLPSTTVLRNNSEGFIKTLHSTWNISDLGY